MKIKIDELRTRALEIHDNFRDGKGRVSANNPLVLSSPELFKLVIYTSNIDRDKVVAIVDKYCNWITTEVPDDESPSIKRFAITQTCLKMIFLDYTIGDGSNCHYVEDNMYDSLLAFQVKIEEKRIHDARINGMSALYAALYAHTITFEH